MNHHLRFPPGSRRVEAAVVGAGAFGRSFLAQGRRMALMGARIAVDRDVATAAAGFAAVGVPAPDIAGCATAAEARIAWDRGACVAADRLDTVLDLPFDVLVEASGQPEPAAVAALAAIRRGRHVALVSKEADSVVGPWLAAEAAAHGVVCTPVDGDQPSLLIDLVTWAEVLGLEVIAAGKSSEYDFVFDPAAGRVTTESGSVAVSGFDALWTLPAGDVAPMLARRAALIGLPVRAVPDLCEMQVVANATGLCPDVPGFHVPILRVNEVATVFDTREEGGLSGGLLGGMGRLDVFNCLRLPDELSFAGGVFLTVRCTDPATWRVLEGKGHLLGRSGRAGLVYLPRHLLGIEAPFSVLDAVLNGRSSAGATVRPRFDLVARAAADLPAGRVLSAEGHHHEIRDLVPELVPAAPLRDGEAIPYYLLANQPLARPVRRGDAVTLADVAFEPDSALLRMREAQDALFGGARRSHGAPEAA